MRRAAGIIGLLLVALTLVLAPLAGMTARQWVSTYTLTNLVLGVSFAASGGMIAWYRPDNLVGRLLLTSGIAQLLTAALTPLLLYGIGHHWAVPLVRTVSTVQNAAWQPSIGIGLPLALLLFPDGHLPGPRWRGPAWLIVLSGAYQPIEGALSDGSVFGPSRDTSSIVSVGMHLPVLNTIAGLAGTVCFPLILLALGLRYRRGDERTRRQLLWLILAVVAIVVINLQRWATGNGPILLLLSFALLPVAIGIAIVRYRLLDIRLVLSRTLVYGLTLSVVVAAYAGIVAALSLLVPAGARTGVPVVAALAVALALNPIRLLVQRSIDQAFFGTRGDPAAAARLVGEGLRGDGDLAGLLERVRTALRLPGIALLRLPGGTLLAEAGAPGEHRTDIPLTYHGEAVGTLVAGLRKGESGLHRADRATLDLVATPLAVALHAIALSAQVRQARAATVEAGAAERVRLQHQLHDGLGPTLTSIVFRADAASNLLASDVPGARHLLGEVRGELRQAVDDVRRVVYGLRPIELDDMGLVKALRQRVTSLAAEGAPITVDLDAPDELDGLSPAVELAAYRIVTEALTNVLRHSTGRRCRVTVAATGPGLHICVTDDGTAPVSWRPGVGLRSLTDRVEELGGTVTIGPSAAGWTVEALLESTYVD